MEVLGCGEHAAVAQWPTAASPAGRGVRGERELRRACRPSRTSPIPGVLQAATWTSWKRWTRPRTRPVAVWRRTGCGGRPGSRPSRRLLRRRGAVPMADHDPVPTGGAKAGKPTGEPLRILRCNADISRATRCQAGWAGWSGSWMRATSWTSRLVRPPSVGLTVRRPGWPWSSGVDVRVVAGRLDGRATWLTKSSPLELV